MGKEHPDETSGREGRDAAGIAAFLASVDAEYITGQTINVNGGLFMS